MAFLRKNFRKSIAFIDHIWSKIKKDSHYQQKKIQDWVFYLKHLQPILMKFNAKYIPTEDLFGQYFFKTFRPLIKLWINKKGQELDG